NDAAGMVSLSNRTVEADAPPGVAADVSRRTSLRAGNSAPTTSAATPRGDWAGESIPEFIRPSQQPNQFGLMLRQLELLNALGGACLSQLLQHTVRLVHRRSVILFFSDLLE